MIYYVIRDINGLYYSGHSGKFIKNISGAKFYTSVKTAVRNYSSLDNFSNLEVIKVNINPSEEDIIKITDEMFNEYDNYNYETYQRRNKKISI